LRLRLEAGPASSINEWETTKNLLLRSCSASDVRLHCIADMFSCLMTGIRMVLKFWNFDKGNLKVQ
uniref:Ovule protein n=1 Tax=Haemonchus placei TaxID=6290 RepID=A0A0N4WFF2_HAEPC